MPDDPKVQIPLIAFEIDASNLKQVEKAMKAMAQAGKKELEKALEGVEKQVEAYKEQVKYQRESNKYLEFERKLQAKTNRMLLVSGRTPKGQRRTHKWVRDEFQLKKKMQAMEVKHLRQIVRLSDPRERIRRLGKVGQTVEEQGEVREARGELRRRAFRGVMGATGRGIASPFRAYGAFKAGRAGKKGEEIGEMKGFKELNKVLGTVGRVMSLIEKSPMWKIFMKLLDFNGLFRFNKELLAASGGIDMLRGSLREGAGAFANIQKEIWDNADALHNMGDNLQFMVKADERLAALRGFEIAGIKAVEFTETFGKGTDDITLQAVALGRVTGLQTSDIASYMGEFIQKMGIARADIGAVFSTLVADATESGISQRFFIDQIRMATSALGMYEFNLSGVSKLLRDMTKNSLQPANVAMKDFENLMSMGKGMSVGQLGASFQIAIRDAGFGRGIATLQRVMEQRLDPKVFGEGVAKRLGGMNRPQFNAMLEEMIETKRLNKDQQRELRSVFDAVHGLRKGQEGNFFELSEAVKAGALGPDFMAMMLNAVAQQQMGVKDFKSLNAIELKVLSNLVGIGADQLRTMRDTVPSTKQIIESLEQTAQEQSLQGKRLQDMIDVSQMIQKATENPDKSFEIIMEQMVRMLQRLVVQLVHTLIPYLVDLTAMILKGIVGLFQLMFSLVEHFVNTGDFGRQLWNTMAAIGGGQQVTKEAWDKVGGEWWDAKTKIEKENIDKEKNRIRAEITETKNRRDLEFGERMKIVKGLMKELREVVPEKKDEGLIGDFQDAFIAGYKSEAKPQLDKLIGLIEEREKYKKEISEEISNLKDSIKDRSRGEKQKEKDKKDLEILKSLLDVTEKYLKLGLEAQKGAEKNLREAKSSRAMATATTNLPEVIRKLELIRIKKKVPGRADGGLMITPQIAAFAEKEPEIALPLSGVPKVMAETIRLAGAAPGGMGGISIGVMNFQLPDAAKHNPQAFAQAVRRVFLEESLRLAKGRRPV